MTTGAAREKATGLSIFFVVLALAGALTMALGASTHTIAAGGFAIALLGGALAVAAWHGFA